jgi:predicted AAA+ superfamily ATPase
MIIDVLTENFVSLLASMKIEYRRYFTHEIDMEAKLVGIVGPRGVGKTTFLLQYLKNLDLPLSKKLYFSADSVEIADHSLVEIAKRFHALGGELLAIDEIHKYPDFEKELKTIYDLLDLKVVFSGSSAIRLEHSKADLSRRVNLYRVYGLSYREFLELKTGEVFPSYTLEEILQKHMEIALSINERIKPLASWREYLEKGYYPFYFDNPVLYHQRLENIVNTVIEVDLPSLFPMKYENVVNLKRLVKLICLSEPFKINIAELSRKINIDRDTLYLYIDYLAKGSIFHVLRPKSRGDAIFVKPEKLYLHNTNLNYAYCETPKIGTIREIFAINQLSARHKVEYPKNGDLLVDGKYLFEIGGKKKGYVQIKDEPHSYLLSDEIAAGSGNKIPLWLMGFLY